MPGPMNIKLPHLITQKQERKFYGQMKSIYGQMKSIKIKLFYLK